MASYVFTQKAIDDLNQIWTYTAEAWSEEQADRYYHLLLNTFQRIANHPTLGKHYDSIRPDLFGLRAGRHIVFYRPHPTEPLEITRILHERMDLEERMQR
jgi:toxin ParE1/3/4